VTQDRQYKSNTLMAYAQDRINLFDDKMELDVGVTYQRFREIYNSAVEFSGERSLEVASGVLPKISALYRLGENWEVFASGAKISVRFRILF